MQRYFCSTKKDNLFYLSSEDSYHVRIVMRMKINDKIEIVDKENLYICQITAINNQVVCEIIEKKEKEEEQIPKVVIAQGIVKEQKMDYIIQKGTELGVYSFIPLLLNRSVIKIKDKETKKVERWKKIVKEASEQCKRNKMPIIEEPCNIKELLSKNFKYKFICSVNEKSKTIKSVLSNISISDTILFVVGPEGGFDPNEERILLENGFESITFGSSILRTETASLFIMSSIIYEFMR